MDNDPAEDGLWSSGHRARLKVWPSEFESCWSLHWASVPSNERMNIDNVQISVWCRPKMEKLDYWNIVYFFL